MTKAEVWGLTPSEIKAIDQTPSRTVTAIVMCSWAEQENKQRLLDALYEIDSSPEDNKEAMKAFAT